MTSLYSLNKSGILYNRAELLNNDSTADLLFKQHQAIVESICQAKPAEAEKAAHAHIDHVVKLIETSLERRSREALSVKRYKKLDG